MARCRTYAAAAAKAISPKIAEEFAQLRDSLTHFPVRAALVGAWHGRAQRHPHVASLLRATNEGRSALRSKPIDIDLCHEQ
jgi:hypothetical protein